MINKFERYVSLTTGSYNEAVAFLLITHGEAKDDYFREKSYERFLKKEIKSIARGKYSRTSEGLYCHHIAENEYLNLANKDFILSNKYSFELQRKEKLVYCDLFEHLILHALIAKETSGEYGLPGYDANLYPMAAEWYIDRGIPPRPEWMKKCFERAFLEPDEARKLLQNVESLLSTEGIETHQRYVAHLRAAFLKREKEYKQREKARKEKETERRTQEFYQMYPNFKKMNINFNTPREKVISMLYDLKYSPTFKNKKELYSALNPNVKAELLNELYLTISE